jgi:HSP20 family protein
MANLTRWDPFREMALMRSWMDRMLEESNFGLRGGEQEGAGAVALDVAEDNDSFIVHASIPGINPEDVEITLQNDVLTIRGQTSQQNEQKNQRFHLRERRFGSFTRSIVLPSAVNREEINATCENGVLTIRLPKSQEQKPRRISINAGRTIEHSQTPQVGEVTPKQSGQSGQSTQSNGGKTQRTGQSGGRKSASQSGHAEAAAGAGNGQTQPQTDEQSSSAQTQAGLEGKEG